MPVTAGHVPGATSGLRTVRLDPGHFRTGRWFLLAEGVVVSAFGVAGLVSAVLHPHAGHTGAPVLGMSWTPAHSAVLLVLGVAAMGAAGKRRAAVAVTATSATVYMALLFFSSVATTRAKPTLLGFHAADVLLHGVLAVVNLALLMWLIPDELGDPTWVPRRRRGRERQASEAVREPAATSVSVPSASAPAPPTESAASQAPEREAHRELPVSARDEQTNESPPIPTPSGPGMSRGAVLVVVAVLAAVGIVIVIRRRSHR